MKHTSTYIDLAFCAIILPLLILTAPVGKWWESQIFLEYSFTAWLYVTYFIYRRFVFQLLTSGMVKRICAVVCIIATIAINYFFAKSAGDNVVWLQFIAVAVSSLGAGAFIKTIQMQQECDKIERQRDKAELALYKAQITPHFLFNTLSNIYGLLITKSPLTQVSMERFIDLTKYIYSNAASDFVPIDNELNCITQYIELQSLRLNEDNTVSFTHNIDNHALMIAPMILVTFIENAFKHGVSSIEKSHIDISFAQKDNCLYFSVVNPIISASDSPNAHTGIDNCRKRLALFYSNRHTLEIKNDGNTFRVNLKLQLS